MAKKGRLLTALDAHRGRDYEAEKRVKKAREAEKKKHKKTRSSDGGVRTVDGVESTFPVQDEPNALEQQPGSHQEEEDDLETFSEGEDDEQEDEDGEDDAPSASEADVDSDLPLSDLSEEDRADTIPHQRLTINNTAALIASTNRVSLTRPKMRFSAHNSLVLTSLPPASTSIPDHNDDLTRELEFYRICRTAATDARALLKKDKVPFARPSDYFAEMVKSDEHMGRVKKKLYDEAANKKAAADARRVRDAKKFGKAVQVAKEQERAREKKQTLEKINSLKRSTSGHSIWNY